jgi:hypothetical protein
MAAVLEDAVAEGLEDAPRPLLIYAMGIISNQV